MRRRNGMALVLFVVFYVSFGAFLTIFQERIIYQPSMQDFGSCENFQDSTKIEHQGTRMYVKDTNKPTAVLYHGNAGSACDRALYADIFTQAGYGYIIVEYAGYSNDARRPSHELIRKNVQHVLEYTKENNITATMVVGESIGTGVASYHASLQPPKKLLLISPFTNLADVASKRFWFYPTGLLVNNAFDNVTLLEQYHNQSMIIHGNRDTIIAYELGQRLFAMLESQKQFIVIDGAGHNDLFLFPSTYKAISGFLAQQ